MFFLKLDRLIKKKRDIKEYQCGLTRLVDRNSRSFSVQLSYSHSNTRCPKGSESSDLSNSFRCYSCPAESIESPGLVGLESVQPHLNFLARDFLPKLGCNWSRTVVSFFFKSLNKWKDGWKLPPHYDKMTEWQD